MDISSFTTPQLLTRFRNTAGQIQDLRTERLAIEAELRKRKAAAAAIVSLNTLTPDQREALRLKLKETP